MRIPLIVDVSAAVYHCSACDRYFSVLIHYDTSSSAWVNNSKPQVCMFCAKENTISEISEFPT